MTRSDRSGRTRRPLWWLLAALGVAITGAGIAALVVLGLLLAPLAVWLAWNVLDLGSAVGLGDLSFWGVVLLALFLASGWFVRVVIVALVFAIEPAWYGGTAELQFPEPSLAHFVAVAILLAVAGLGHATAGTRGARE